MATPAFLFALILLYIAVMYLDTSAGGLFSTEFQSAAYGRGGNYWTLLKHMWMPVIVLGTLDERGIPTHPYPCAATMLDEKNQLYVTVARAKGIRKASSFESTRVRAALEPGCQAPSAGSWLHRVRITHHRPRCSPTGYRPYLFEGAPQPGYLISRVPSCNHIPSPNIIGNVFLSDLLLAGT